MPLPKKYLFDVSFDQPQGPGGPMRKPAEPHFSRADLESARTAGHAEGHAAGLAAAATAAEQRSSAALDTLSAGLAALAQNHDAIAAELRKDALALLRLALGKLAPALCHKEPLAEIEAVLAQCLAEALDE